MSKPLYELCGPTVSFEVRERNLYVGKSIIELLPADITKNITIDSSSDRLLSTALSLVDRVVFSDGTAKPVEEFALLMGFDVEN